MIIKRIAEGVRSQDWFVVGVEIMIVVVGIFIGLQVDDWNERRSDSKKEQEYLNLLVRDLTQFEEALNIKIAWEQKKIKIGDKLYSILEKNSFNEDRALIGSSLIALASRMTLSVESAAYTDLKSTGNLSLIKDSILRNKIIYFFTMTQRLQLILDKNNKNYIDEGFIPFMKSIGISFRQASDTLDPELLTFIDTRLQKESENLLFSNIMRQDDAILKLPEDSPIWLQIKQQTSWRVMVAMSDKVTATELLNETKTLKVEIQQHLTNIK